jgi:hypothetical protein
MDQTTSSYQTVLRRIGERGENPNLDCRVDLSTHRHHQKTAQTRNIPLYVATDFIRHPFREKALTTSTSEPLQNEKI